MSQSTFVGAERGPRGYASRDDGETTIDAEENVVRLLDILHDDDCREILEATSDEALSASEISDACDVPLSTAYRKLELLTDAGLLAEGTRLCQSGKHTSEYSRTVGDVSVSVTADGEFEATVTRRERSNAAQVPTLGENR